MEEIRGESGRRRVEEETREWYETKRGYALARHMVQNKPKIVKHINKQEKYEEERREEMMEEIGIMTERGRRRRDMRVNHATTTIRKKLTPKARQFWLRRAYKRIQPNIHMAKAKEWTDKWPTSKKELETWSHMEYECEKLEGVIHEVRFVYDEYVK